MKSIFLLAGWSTNMFWNKRSKLHVDVFTHLPDVYKNSSIIPAKKVMPKWLKDLPSTNSLDLDTLTYPTNMKGCVGVTNALKEGLIIPLWSDLILDIPEEGRLDYRWNLSDPLVDASAHHESERGKYAEATKYAHVKLHSPWAITTKESVKWVWQQPIWHHTDPAEILIPNAVLDYSTLADTNVNLLVRRQHERKQIFVGANTPLVQLIPMTDREVVIHDHLVTNEEWLRILRSNSSASTFRNKHAFANLSNSKCPFHKHTK